MAEEAAATLRFAAHFPKNSNASPPSELRDPVEILQSYLWSLRREPEQQQLQRQEPSHHGANSGVGCPSPALTSISIEQGDQILQVVDTLFGARSSSASPSIVEGALSILDNAASTITRVVSTSSKRSIFLVRSSSSGCSSHYNVRPKHSPESINAARKTFSWHDQTNTPATVTTSGYSSPLYYFCLIPDTGLEQRDGSGPTMFSCNYLFCSCRYHFDHSHQPINSDTCHSLPAAVHRQTNNTDEEEEEEDCDGSSSCKPAAGSVLCKHLLALLLVPALGTQTAVLEMSNDHEFSELVLGRIGL